MSRGGKRKNRPSWADQKPKVEATPSVTGTLQTFPLPLQTMTTLSGNNNNPATNQDSLLVDTSPSGPNHPICPCTRSATHTESPLQLTDPIIGTTYPYAPPAIHPELATSFATIRDDQMMKASSVGLRDLRVSATMSELEDEIYRFKTTVFNSIREMDCCDLIFMLEMNGLSVTGSIEVLRDRQIRYETRAKYGSYAAVWDAERDNRDYDKPPFCLRAAQLLLSEDGSSEAPHRIVPSIMDIRVARPTGLRATAEAELLSTGCPVRVNDAEGVAARAAARDAAKRRRWRKRPVESRRRGPPTVVPNIVLTGDGDCWLCHRLGHRFRQCPMREALERAGHRICYSCGLPGYDISSCPQCSNYHVASR